MLTASFNRTGAYIVVATALFVSRDPGHAVLLRGVPARASARVARRARCAGAAHGLGALPRDPAQGADAPEVIRKHTQKEREKDGAGRGQRCRACARCKARRRSRGGRPTSARRRRAAAAPRPPLQPAPLRATPRRDARRRATRTTDDAGRPRRRRRARAQAARAAARRAQRRLRAAAARRILDEIKPDGGMDKARLFEKAQDAAGQVRRVRRDGQRGGDPPRPGGHDLRVQARRRASSTRRSSGLADDLALALEAESIRIDRMSGRGTVGIEIPNEVRETISLREIIESRRLPARRPRGSPWPWARP